MFEQLVIQYGYAMIVTGTFLEGETVLLIGGYLAHMGYLQLPWVILFAFLGTFAGDQLFFYIGRHKGMGFIERRPRWRVRTKAISKRLHRHKYIVIIGFRFVYGMRTVTPFLLGASGIRPLTFLGLNIVGAALWSVTIGSLGYALGHTVTLLLSRARHYELYGIMTIAGAAVILWGWRYYRSGRAVETSRD